jgi:thioredoxin 1
MKHALYFTADWCNPCERTRPIVEDLNKDSYTKFQFIDVDDNGDLCKKFEIKSVPTFILIKDGVEIKRMNGSKTKEQLQEFISYE